MIFSGGISDHTSDYSFVREAGFPYWTFSLFRKGGAFMRSGSLEIETQPYDLKCIRPNTTYSTRGLPGNKYWEGDWLISTLRDEWEQLINWNEVLPGIYKINIAGSSNQEKIINSFRKALNYFHSSKSHSDVYAMHAFEEVLLLATEINEERPNQLDERIIKAIEILSVKFDEYLDVEIVAEEVGLSPSRLAHFFKEQVGESPMSYRESIRLKNARGLLIGTNMTVQEVANEVYYDCPFHFSKRFKVRMGMSPKNFRSRMGEPGFLESFNSSQL